MAISMSDTSTQRMELKHSQLLVTYLRSQPVFYQTENLTSFIPSDD